MLLSQAVLRRGAAILVAVLALSGLAHAEMAMVEVSHPWARATPMRASTAAVYLTLTSMSDDTLTGVSTPAAKTAEVHETLTTADGVMQMRPLAAPLELPAGKAVTLSPGHLHVMLTGLYAPLTAGHSLTLRLVFAHAPPMQVTVPVMAVGAIGSEMPAMPGMKM